MNQVFCVAYEQNVIVYKFLTQKVCFDTMALLAWWSATEAKLITEQFDIDSWIIEVSTFYRRKKLRSLEYLLELDPFD